MKGKLAKIEEETCNEVLNVRWLKFNKYYLDSGKAYESALKAGFSEAYAIQIKTKMPEKVRKNLVEALEAEGITSEKVAKKINVLLEAKKLITKNNNETGEIDVVAEQPDYQAIDKGIVHAAKIGIGGGYKSEDDKPQKHIHVHFDLSGLSREQKQKFAMTGELPEELYEKKD